MTEHPEHRSDDGNELSSHSIRILDWFAMEGADVAVNLNNAPDVHVALGELEYFVGPPLCEGPSWGIECDGPHVIEVGGIAVLGSPLSEDLLGDLVSPFKPTYDGRCPESDIAVEEDDTTDANTVWVFRRFSADDLSSDDFDSKMREFIAQTNRVSKAILS